MGLNLVVMLIEYGQIEEILIINQIRHGCIRLRGIKYILLKMLRRHYIFKMGMGQFLVRVVI